METVTVLGAGGFIGCNMVSFLKEKGYYVRAVDVVFPEERKEKFDCADQVELLDLRDPFQARVAVAGSDWVINFAADMGGVGYFHAHDYNPFINNMLINAYVLKACEHAKVKRLFFSSSACIYPIHLQQDVKNVPSFSEDMIYPANSDQMYGWEKLMTLRLCERAPFDARVGILHTVFGPFQEIQGERMKFPTAITTKVIQSKKDGKPIEIWGDGSQVRSYCYIDDALEKIYRVISSDNYEGPVNIGSDEAVSVEEVAIMLCKMLGVKQNFSFNPQKPSGVLARNSNNSKFEKLYGYRNRVSTKEGFRRLAEWIESLK